MSKKDKRNKDIIEFRYELINQLCSDDYFFNGVVCNDGRNVMTKAKKQVIEDVLVRFNIFFRSKGYELG